MGLSRELKRLGTQSAIYGLGGVISRLIAVFLIPIYTVYLGRVGFGKIETIIALTSVLVIVLRFGITSAIVEPIVISTFATLAMANCTGRSSTRKSAVNCA